MEARRLARLLLPAAAGLAVLLLCRFGADLGWPAAAILSGATWAGLGLFLYRRDPLKALGRHRGLGIDPKLIASEIATARERIARIRTAASGILDRHLAAPLDEIALIADAIASEVLNDPRDYPRVRRALVYYLEHTTAIAEGLAQMPANHTAATPALARANETLPQLVTTFQGYRDRLAENEAFDIETRLTLLERDLPRATPNETKKTSGDEPV